MILFKALISEVVRVEGDLREVNITTYELALKKCPGLKPLCKLRKIKDGTVFLSTPTNIVGVF